jgi:tripartite-type tricarboxylate transporter receptor subunit TctC
MNSIRPAAIATLLVLASAPATAQTNYPERNIRLIYGFPPGSDVTARLVADKLAESLRTPVTVDNVTGAAGNIAADRTAKAAPDGYTIGLLAGANIVINVSLYKKLPYDPVTDLVPITQVWGYANVLVVNNDVSAKSVEELVGLARAQPGKLTFGHAGVGTTTQLSGELLKSMAHIDLQDVPYRGPSLIVPDLISGRITISCMAPAVGLPLVREGKLRALAVTSRIRAPFAPNLPTMEESGFLGFDMTVWFGMFAPGGTPASIVEKLNRETVKIMAMPEVGKRLYEIGNVPLGNSPAEFAEVIKAETPFWARVIKVAGITGQCWRNSVHECCLSACWASSSHWCDSSSYWSLIRSRNRFAISWHSAARTRNSSDRDCMWHPSFI